MGAPWRGCPQKEDLTGGGVSVGQAGLLERPGADGSSSLGVAVVAGQFCPVTWQLPMHYPCGEGGCQRKCTKAIT